HALARDVLSNQPNWQEREHDACGCASTSQTAACMEVAMKSVSRQVRIAVIGEAGCAALSSVLARRLDIPHIEWRGGAAGDQPWDVLRGELAQALSGSRWVAVGNGDIAREVLLSRATMIVWLDFAW